MKTQDFPAVQAARAAANHKLRYYREMQMTRELAQSNMTADPGYTRQVITIKKEVYEELRNIAFSDPVRRLKIGDVIESFMKLSTDNVQPEIIQAELNRLRTEKAPITKKELAAQLANLSPEKMAEVLKLLDKP